MTLLQALDDAARGATGIDFVSGRGAGERVTYADLARAAERAAGGLLAALGSERADAAERQPVLLVLPNGRELVTLFFGALHAGLVPAILPAPRAFGDASAWLAGIARTAAHADDAAIITTPSIATLFEGRPVASGAKGPRVLTADAVLSGAPTSRAARPEHTAFLQFTSGSLGAPKGVVISHRAALADAAAIAARTAVAPGDRGLFWVPLAHDMALLSFLMMLVGRIDQIVMPTERFAIDPAGWLEVVAARATMTVGPPFAFGMALERLLKKGARPDLSRLRACVVGAEPIDARLLRRFSAELAPAGLAEHVWIPSYGLAELTCVGCLGAAGAPLVTASWRTSDGRTGELVGHGPPLAGHAVRIVDHAAAVLARGEVGRIQLRGPAAMDGYWRSPEATAAAFDGDWIVTGDLGFVDDLGHGEMVFISGREKDVIIQRGRHFFPDELEALALDVAGVRPRGALAFGEVDASSGHEPVTIVVELDARADEAAVARTIRTKVADALDLAVAVVVVPAGQLPRTTSGKLRRGEGRARWGALARAGPR